MLLLLLLSLFPHFRQSLFFSNGSIISRAKRERETRAQSIFLPGFEAVYYRTYILEHSLPDRQTVAAAAAAAADRSNSLGTFSLLFFTFSG